MASSAFNIGSKNRIWEASPSDSGNGFFAPGAGVEIEFSSDDMGDGVYLGKVLKVRKKTKEALVKFDGLLRED